MHVHRVQSIQVADNQSRRDFQASGQGHADVRKITADARAVAQGIERVGAGIADAVAVVQVRVDPGADRLDLVVARCGMSDDVAGAGFHLVRRAIAALQQVEQCVVRQLGDGRGRCTGRDANVCLGFHHHLHFDVHPAAGHRQALAQIAVAVDVFGGAHPGGQFVALAEHPLRLAAARPQHGYHGAVGCCVEGHRAGGFELHARNDVAVVGPQQHARN